LVAAIEDDGLRQALRGLGHSLRSKLRKTPS